ncbi:30S ribosomal protein S11 [Candidatus Dependentiae bacterium]|nr:MAG: 30S ribosomal protein S11 [Candidatus Dependentiae bacterium]
MAYKKKNKKSKVKVDTVVAHVRSTFNNTMVSITTLEGDVLMQSSAGRLGFKGSRKGTPFAGSQIGNLMLKEVKANHNAKNVEVRKQGPGSGCDSFIRALHTSGLRVTVISDVTPLAHNGPRPPKKRRV